MTQHDSQKRYRFYGPRMPIFPSREALYAYENAMNASKLTDQPGQTDRATPPVPDAAKTPAAGDITRYDSNYPCNRCDRSDQGNQCSRCAWLKGAIDRTQETHPDLYRMMKAVWNDMRREEREAYKAKLRAMTWDESIARWRRLLNEGFSDEDRAYLFANEFVESEHKRDKDGKFATMDGGGAKSRARRKDEEEEEEAAGKAPTFPVTLPHKDQTPLTAPAGSKREYYIVGKRRLDGLSQIYGILHHEQLIADDGTNIGRMADGVRSDSKKMWGDYVTDNVKYDAQLIEEAVKIYAEDKEKSQQTLDELSSRTPEVKDAVTSTNDYTFISQNCQDYIKDILKIAEKLSKERNMPLTKEQISILYYP